MESFADVISSGDTFARSIHLIPGIEWEECRRVMVSTTSKTTTANIGVFEVREVCRPQAHPVLGGIAPSSYSDIDPFGFDANSRYNAICCDQTEVDPCFLLLGIDFRELRVDLNPSKKDNYSNR